MGDFNAGCRPRSARAVCAGVECWSFGRHPAYFYWYRGATKKSVTGLTFRVEWPLIDAWPGDGMYVEIRLVAL
jgi:hypothetical protein